ncbi:MAG: serine/threonine-protein kinase [Gemmatimonadota bacterium]
MNQNLCHSCNVGILDAEGECALCGTAEPVLVMDSDSTTDSLEETARERLAQALGPKFEVRELLGRGGFAEVYEVHDRQLHRRLAVKVLRPDLAWTQGMLQRFEKEARALASLSHPNILPIHFVGDRGGLVYYAMPYVEGNSLGDMLRNEGPLDPERAANLIRPILQALAHAHEKGMIHRDIKPDNIIVEQQTGRPLLVDFGIVKQEGDGPGNTLSGFVVGTPTYMSPEQALGQANVDHRSDLYALGGVLFHLVTGTPPFEGDTSQEVIGRHISQAVPIASDVNTRVPVWLSDVIRRALVKRPEDRFQSAAEMGEALKVGVQSGATLPVISRDSLMRQIRDDDPTHIMPAAKGSVGRRGNDEVAGRRSGDSPIDSHSFGRRSSDAQSTAERIWAAFRWATLIVAVFAVVAYFVKVKPVLTIRNHLTLPVLLRWGDADTVLVPGAMFTTVVPANGKILAQWSVARPRLSDSTPELGVDYRNNIMVDGMSLMQTLTRKVSLDIDSWGSGGDRYFAPLITNATGHPVRVTVNPSTQTPGCQCLVPPGERIPIGYYVLPDTAMIRISLPPRYAVYRDLEKLVDPVSGAIEIRVDSASFKR